MTKKTIFSIRKLSVGVASLAIAGVLTGVVPVINTTAPTASAQPMTQPWNGQIYGKVTVDRVDRWNSDNTVPQVVNTPIAAGETFYLRVKFESTDPAGFLSGVSWVTDFDQDAYEWIGMRSYSKSGIAQDFVYLPDGTRYAPGGMVIQNSAEFEPETYVYVRFEAKKPITEADAFNTFKFYTDWNYKTLTDMYGMGAIPWTIDPLTFPDHASWERAWEGINYDDHSFGTKLVQDNTPAPKYSVAYKFASLDSSLTLPAEVTALLPTDANQYEKDAVVTLERPTPESVAVADGTWEFVGYPSDTVTVGESNVEVTGTWRFVPKPKGSIIVKFVDTNGATLKTETPVSDVVEGTAYDVNSSATPTIEVNGKTYNFKGLQAGSPAAAGNVAAGNTTVVFEYEEDVTVPPVAKGSVVVKFVDENNIELKSETPAQYTNVDENTTYDVNSLVTPQIEVNGQKYDFVGVTSGSLTGNVAAGNNTVVVSYKKVVPVVQTGSVVVEFVDENGVVIKTEKPAQFTNINEGSPYDVASLAPSEIEVGGKKYSFVGVTSGSLTGNVSAGDNKVVVSYKAKASTTPSSSSTTPSSSSTTPSSSSTTPSSSSTTPSSSSTTPSSSSTDASSTDASTGGQVVLKPADGKQLPKTGENTSNGAVVAGLGLLVAGLGFALTRKKKED